MEQSTVSFVQWWTRQKMSDKLPILLLLGLIISVSMNLKQAGQNAALQQEKESQIVECEKRAGTIKEIAAAALIVFYQKNDSINREKERQYQDLLMQRINNIQKSTENFKQR